MLHCSELLVMHGNKYISQNSQNLTLEQLNITNNSVIRVVSNLRSSNPNPSVPVQPKAQSSGQISIIIEYYEVGVGGGGTLTILVAPNIKFKHLYERIIQIFGNDKLTIMGGTKYLTLTNNGEMDLQMLRIDNGCTIRVLKTIHGGL